MVDQKRIDEALKEVRKKFGPDAARRGSKARAERQFIQTGALALDRVLGGGYIRGRTYELYGDESTGKTTLACSAIERVQAADGVAAYIDVERAIDWDYVEALGVNTDDLIFLEPKTAEDGLEMVRDLVLKGVDLVCCDTVAALASRAEKKGDIGDAHVGILPRLMSQAMKIVTSDVKDAGSVLLFLNQVREKVGVMWGEKETTPGGKALKFYSSGRLQVSPGTLIKRGKGTSKERSIGRWVRVFIKKSKTSVPLQTVRFPLIFGEGIDRGREIFLVAKDAGLLTKKGKWYAWEDRKWNGEPGFLKAVKKDPGLIDEIRAALG